LAWLGLAWFCFALLGFASVSWVHGFMGSWVHGIALFCFALL